MTEPAVERIVVDPRQNRLILEIDDPLPATGKQPATIDIGALGRLIGIEIAGVYLGISDPVPGSDHQIRSASVTVEVSNGGRRVMLSRRGPNWELSFPSGNQCWIRSDGDEGPRTLCSVLTGS